MMLRTHRPIPMKHSIKTNNLIMIGSWLGLLCIGRPAYSANKEPVIKVTTTPATATHGPVVKIEGTIGFDYFAHADVANDTTFDLTDLYSTSKEDHPTSTAFVAGEQQTPPKNLQP